MFDDMFSSTDILGMLVKYDFQKRLRDNLKDADNDYAIAMLKVIIESCEELIKEREAKM